MNVLAVIAPLSKGIGFLHRTRIRLLYAVLLVVAIPVTAWAVRSFWPETRTVPGETRIEYRSDPLELDYIEKLERDLTSARRALQNRPTREIRYPAPPPETLIEHRFLIPQGLTVATCPVDMFGTPLLETGRDWLRLTTFDDVGAARQFEYVFQPKPKRWGLYAGFGLDSPFARPTFNDALAHSTLWLEVWVRGYKRLELYAEPYLDFSLLDGRGFGVMIGGRYKIR